MPEETDMQCKRADEILRQETETFNQIKKHDEIWFFLKLLMGIGSVIIMFIVLFFSIYILYNYKQFSDAAIITAGIGLISDIIASCASVWKLTMNPKSNAELKPVATPNLSESNKRS